MIVEKSSQKIGMAPGSAVYVGAEKPTHDINIQLIEYNTTQCKEANSSNITDFAETLTSSDISWINLDGVHDVEMIKKLGNQFNIHPLTIEDILNTTQRPKVEITDNYVYVTLKMIIYDNKKETFIKEQLSIILLNNLVITIQEIPGDIFDSLRARILKNKGKIRKMGADYLLYAILDCTVDGYFEIIDRLDTELEDLEEKIEESENVVQDIHWLKKELLYIRRVVSPVRDIISNLMREESQIITEQTYIYLRDTYDHCTQVYESIEIIRDIVSGLIEIHLSVISNRMNEIMKYLTIFASIFIPLTFVTGIYGMNFENMPELKWEYGYFYLLSLLLIFGVCLLVLFKRKKWL
jgi:magnesium transporter